MSSSTRSRIATLRKELLEWGQVNIRDFPWRKKQSPFSILVAEVLLRRTTAPAVLRIYSSFMNDYGTIEKILVTDEKQIAKALQPIGYYKQRAKILKDISVYICQKLDGAIPSSKESLLEIPHVGNYTAGAILSLGYNQASAMVDTNVKRIYKRVFLHSLPKRAIDRYIDHLASECVPKDKHQLFNLTLLDLAALICRYGTPKCQVCPICMVCDYFEDSKQLKKNAY